MNLFDEIKIDLSKVTCHSGGADGSDTAWEKIGENFGVKTKAYSYKTKKHQSSNKIEISDEDYQEGILEVNKANKYLNRYGIHKYMNLLARNWAQVKYSNQIFAIGTIVKSGEKGSKGYYNKGKYDVVDGGTGYAIMMGINHKKDIYIFDQLMNMWYRWSYITQSFVEMIDIPLIESYDFAGIGTRGLLPNGMKAIREVYEKTYKK
jgi:hypothetical protein